METKKWQKNYLNDEYHLCGVFMRKMIVLLGLLYVISAHADHFILQSDRFAMNTKIPVTYTCDGKNISPPLFWNKPSDKTAAYALIVSSPDSPPGLTYYWVIYNIPAIMSGLGEGANKNLPDGVVTGSNSVGDSIYRGPCPPDDDTYHYVFSLYALDAKLDLVDSSDINDIITQINRHTVDETELVGTFNH